MIKYKERNFKEDGSASSSLGLEVFDSSGKKYVINFNNFDELEITATDGKIAIEPSYSNRITITTKE